jgi:hypothetical protein
MRNQLDALERLWGELGAQLKSPRRGEAFAEMALRIRDWRQWPDTYGCQERTHIHEVDVIEGVRWAQTGERGIIVDGLFIVAPDPTRAEASAHLGAPMKELLASREAPTAREALRIALEESPDAARVYCATR